MNNKANACHKSEPRWQSKLLQDLRKLTEAAATVRNEGDRFDVSWHSGDDQSVTIFATEESLSVLSSELGSAAVDLWPDMAPADAGWALLLTLLEERLYEDERWAVLLIREDGVTGRDPRGTSTERLI